MTMRLNHSILISSILFVFLLTSCRTDPKLPPVALDTTVNVRIPSEPRGLNFLLNSDRQATTIMRQIALPLSGFNANTYEAEPILIKTLPSVKEITTGPDAGLVAYTFDLLEEAVWDDGIPMTAKDFIFTVKATFNPHYRSPYSSQFSSMNRVEIDPASDKKFTVYSDKYVVGKETLGNFTLLPSHLLDPENIYANYPLKELQDPANKEKYKSDEQLKKLGAILTSPKNMGQDGELSGSGPYKLKEWKTGESVTLIKKENWWGNALSSKYPKLKAIPKKIVYKVVPDFNAAISLMRNGEIDLISNTEVREIVKLKKDEFFKKNFNFYAPSSYQHLFIMLNTLDPKLSDKKVRRALAHLMDLKEISDAVYMGEDNVVTTPVHPSKPYYHKGLSPISYDVEKAKTLLQEAGWSDTNNNGTVDKIINGELTELSLEYSYSGSSKNGGDVGQLFKEAAQPAGVDITVSPMEGRPLGTSYRSKTFELSPLGSSWYPFYEDFYHRWSSQSGGNYFSFGNAESDKLIETINKTTDPVKLNELYMRFQEIVYEEQPVIFFHTGFNQIMVHKKFGKINTSQISSGYFVNELSLNTVPITVNNN